MERAARRLVAFSFVSFLAVIALGTIRGLGPVRVWLEGPELQRVAALFHSHFDQLCWLGTAATGAALWITRDAYRGPAWAPALLAWSYPIGALLFSTAFLVKVVGLRIGSEALSRVAYASLVSLGGALLLVALVAGAVIGWGFRGAVPGREGVGA
jgi:hypothetical protein